MTRKVRLSGNARAFLQREAKYLRDRSPFAAEIFLAKLRDARRNLAQFPEMGRRRDGLPVRGAMRLVVGDYILTYDLIADDVAISSIRHARQSDPDIAHDAVVEFEVDADRSSIDEPDD